MILRSKDMREDNDLTQVQVAKILMCDQSLCSKYDWGEREMPLRLLAILVERYNVSLDYLAGRTNKKTLTYNLYCK